MKKGSEERRVIMDLSFPQGNSVNDKIPKDQYMGQSVVLKYPKVDSLVEIIKRKGRGCALMKEHTNKFRSTLLTIISWV